MRVAVVGNPCNTNAWICQQAAKGVPPERFTAMTRLDQNRAQAQLAQKAGVPITDVKGTLIWGNHSATQVPDFFHATIKGKPVTEVVADHDWLKTTFISTVQKRGAAIIEARGVSSAGLELNDFLKEKIAATVKELEGEREVVKALVS